MAIFHLEGFEFFEKGMTSISQSVAEVLLSTMIAEDTWRWPKVDTTSVETEAHGQTGVALIIDGVASGDALQDDKGFSLRYGFTSKRAITFGYAFKLTEKPISAVPLFSFTKEYASDYQTALTVWVTPSGRVAVSSSHPNRAAMTSQAPAISSDVLSAPSVVVFGGWSYLEISVVIDNTPNVSGSYATFDVHVDNVPVIANATHSQIITDNDPLVGLEIHMPSVSLFGGNPFKLLWDDMYLADAAQMLGPHHLLPIMSPGNTSNLTLPSTLPSLGTVELTEVTDIQVTLPSPLDATVSVTAIMVSILHAGNYAQGSFRPGGFLNSGKTFRLREEIGSIVTRSIVHPPTSNTLDTYSGETQVIRYSVL